MAVKLSIDVVPNAISNNKKNLNNGSEPFDKPEKRKQIYHIKFAIYDLVFWHDRCTMEPFDCLAI